MGFASRTNNPEQSGDKPADNNPSGSKGNDPQKTTDGNDNKNTPSKDQPQDSKTSNGSSNRFFYQVPGGLDDLDGLVAKRAEWSSLIDNAMTTCIQDRKTKGLDVLSYNPARETKSSASTSYIKWLAFPSNCRVKRPDDDSYDPYKAADIRENQDEYCEWEVEREGGELKSVTFTTEVPEYWSYFAKADSTGALLLRQYKALNPDVADQIKKEDLFSADGKYNSKNRWNAREGGGKSGQDGRIAHLIRDNNYVLEAASLVVDSTVVRKDSDGRFITDGASLLRAMDPPVSDNSPNRNSDPNITAFINKFARSGKLVTVANPVGLYIDSFEHTSFVTDDGGSVSNLWTIERKSEDGRYSVRGKFSIPAGLRGKIRNKRSGRKLEYGSQLAESLWIIVYVTIAEPGSTPSPGPLQSHPVYSYIEGRQIKPTQIPQDVVDNEIRREPFGAYLASTEKPAKTLKDLIATFEDYTWAAFAADEGIGFYNDTVRVRMVLIWLPNYPAKPRAGQTSSKMGDIQKLKEAAFKTATVTIVALPPFDDKQNIHSEKSILQIASYDPELGWFNFYDREKSGQGRFLYFGNSKDAFDAATHGLGPFCGHPNGGLAMKEMQAPWTHWHSSFEQLDLKDNHPLLKDPLFRDQRSDSWYFGFADHLSTIVAEGTRQWFQTRRFLDFGSYGQPAPIAQRVHQWIAHVCMNTTVEITSTTSRIPSSSSAQGSFSIPETFFLNLDALGLVIDNVGTLTENIRNIPWDKYLEASSKLGLGTFSEFSLTTDDDKFAVKSEGAVAWKSVTPSFEDTEGISLLLKSGLLPKNIVAAILMIDFSNPVFSSRRAQLMRYVPSTAVYDQTAPPADKYTLGTDFVEAVERGIAFYGYGDSSPEAEFVRLARNPNLFKESFERLKVYVNGINAHMKTSEGVLDYMRVAETRRRMFRPPPKSRRPNHPLAEFELTLPYAQKMDPKFVESWAMKPDGTVENVTSAQSVWHPRDTQAHFIASGCPFSQGV